MKMLAALLMLSVSAHAADKMVVRQDGRGGCWISYYDGKKPVTVHETAEESQRILATLPGEKTNYPTVEEWRLKVADTERVIEADRAKAAQADVNIWLVHVARIKEENKRWADEEYARQKKAADEEATKQAELAAEAKHQAMIDAYSQEMNRAWQARISCSPSTPQTQPVQTPTVTETPKPAAQVRDDHLDDSEYDDLWYEFYQWQKNQFYANMITRDGQTRPYNAWAQDDKGKHRYGPHWDTRSPNSRKNWYDYFWDKLPWDKIKKECIAQNEAALWDNQMRREHPEAFENNY